MPLSADKVKLAVVKVSSYKVSCDPTCANVPLVLWNSALLCKYPGVTLPESSYFIIVCISKAIVQVSNVSSTNKKSAVKAPKAQSTKTTGGAY